MALYQGPGKTEEGHGEQQGASTVWVGSHAGALYALPAALPHPAVTPLALQGPEMLPAVISDPVGCSRLHMLLEEGDWG